MLFMVFRRRARVLPFFETHARIKNVAQYLVVGLSVVSAKMSSMDCSLNQAGGFFRSTLSGNPETFLIENRLTERTWRCGTSRLINRNLLNLKDLYG